MKNVLTKLFKRINKIPAVMKILSFLHPKRCLAIAGFEWHDENSHTRFRVRFERQPVKKNREIGNH